MSQFAPANDRPIEPSMSEEIPPDITRRTGARAGLPLTLPLHRVAQDQRGLVGGKAANLAALMRAMLPVPPGFCVTAPAFDEFLNSCQNPKNLSRILSCLSTEQVGQLGHLSDNITALLAGTTIPPQVEAAILAAWHDQGEERAYAVRSSATSEDAAERSFAGQFESTLNVCGRDALLAAIKKCWLSLFSARALAYQAKHGLSVDKVAMAVVVQEMVPATAAGVLFTVDPVTGSAARIVIEGTHGLGDRLVSGKVNPERVVLDKETLRIIERHATNEPSCLDESLARGLGELARKVERLFGGPQDIEWAVCGGEIHLLQARPTTGTRPARTWEERQIWSNANSGEAVPDVLTPMTYSMLMPFVQGLCDNLLGPLGYRIRVEQLLSLIAGRAYFNVNLGFAMLQRLPRMWREGVGDIFGGAQEHLARSGQIQLGPDDLPRLQFNPWRAVCGSPSMVVAMMRFSLLPGSWTVQALRQLRDELGSMSPETCSDEALLQAIRAALPAQELGGHQAMRFMVIGAFHLVALFALSKRWFGAEGRAMAGRLTAGLGTLNPAEAGRDLWRLAEFAALHPELRHAVEEETVFAAFERRLQASDEGRAFLELWRAFLARHGHHARGEVELMNPRWCEEPEVVLGLVRNYLEVIIGNLAAPATRLAELGEQRMALEKECLRRLKNPFKRGLFRWTLRCAQRGVAIKENVKSEGVRRISRVRLQLLELGRRLVKRGRFADPSDVFFLTVEELRCDFLFGSDTGLREIVAVRRSEYVRNQKLHPPPVVFGRGNPSEWQAESAAPVVDRLEGLPVSPGVATGRARVLTEVNPEDRVLAGEILVAPSTDPAWSPYFLTAGGIVIDLGGILSHGSILAREYGLPAITNVGSATRVIRTGDLVQVDGNLGCVTILERASKQ